MSGFRGVCDAFGQSIKAKGFFGVGFHLVAQFRILGLACTKLSDQVPRAFSPIPEPFILRVALLAPHGKNFSRPILGQPALCLSPTSHLTSLNL